MKIHYIKMCNKLFSSVTRKKKFKARWMLGLIVGVLLGISISILFLSNYSTNYSSLSEIVCDPINAYAYLKNTNVDALEQLRKHMSDKAHREGNTTVQNYLYDEVRVLCWIMTNPSNHKTKAIHAKNTWGQRCNKLLIMSSVADEELGTIALNVSEGRDNLWYKVREAFRYIYAHHFDDADWFYKADDDTYALMKNMRYMLYPYSKDYPIYFGYKFKMIVQQGYMSGGAGYVMSKETLKRFAGTALYDSENCPAGPGFAEESKLANCLQKLGVIAADSRDSGGRGRFFPFQPEQHLFPFSGYYWYWQYMFYNTTDGMSEMSDNAISFHYVAPYQMWTLEYLIYHLRPYGVIPYTRELPRKIALDEIMPNGSVILKSDGEPLMENTSTPDSSPDAQ